MTSHSERVAKVRAYFEKNKLFSLVVVVIAIVIIGNFIMNGITAIKEKDKPTSYASEEVVENTEKSADTNNNQEEESSHWRFYWIDLWVLVGGGGFCVVKILQEKKKAREKLQ